MDRTKIGTAGLTGWRTKVADTVATPVARRSSFSEDDIRAVVGIAFLVLSVIYVVGSLRRIARRT